MSSALFSGAGLLPNTFYSAAAGPVPNVGAIGGRQRLPTDPVGTFALTLTNVVVGSALQVESASGVTLHNSTTATATVLINLSAYAPGNPLNNLVIKVRKGSAAPYYQPYRTETTAIVGAQSIYVSQIEDQ